MIQALGESDTTTVVTYTIMMWYTQEFRNLFSSTEDMDTFTDLIILETNEAYISGNMPVSFENPRIKIILINIILYSYALILYSSLLPILYIYFIFNFNTIYIAI